jgi:hypothetical protein
MSRPAIVGVEDTYRWYEAQQAGLGETAKARQLRVAMAGQETLEMGR